jgi:hypothetical protein
MRYAEGVHLTRTDENVDEIEALATLLGGRVGLDDVLEDLDRRGRRSLMRARAVHRAYTFDATDRRDQRWWPQGVTTSADASDDEEIAGRRVVAVAWYAKALPGDEVRQGSRITFFDLGTRRYRHVLLVRPVLRDGVPGIEPLNVHAGGIVWAGPYLHVAATRKGFHTVRLEDLLRVPDQLREAAFGYDYVLPVRFSYTAFHDDGHEPLRYSFLSLDKSGPTPELVAGEYGRGAQSMRLARFPLDPATYHLVSGEDGYSRPLLLEEKGEAGMQGAAVVGGRWYLSSSRGPFLPGTLFVGTPGGFRRRVFALPIGPEDLTYWPSTDTFWSASEWPWRRWVFPVRRSRVD